MNRSYVVGAVLAWFSLVSLAVGGLAVFTPRNDSESIGSRGTQSGYLAGVVHGESASPALEIEIPASEETWRPLIELHFSEKDVDQALAVLHCESTGNPNAQHDKSSAAGLFQHLPQFWGERSASAGLPGADIFSPEANIAVAAWLVREGGGWKHWYSSASCWTAIVGV